MTLPIEEVTSEAPSAELVHWMQPDRLRLGPQAIAAAAFALGVIAAVGAFAAFRWLAPRREGLPPWRWRRGPLH